MESYILDTNLFFNFEPGMGLAKKTHDVLVLMTTIAKTMKEKKEGTFVMSPRVVDELLSFFENKQESDVQSFLSAITTQSPDLQTVTVPTHAVSSLVEETRQRSYRGLQVAEEEIQQAAHAFTGSEVLQKVPFQKKIGEFIRHFRERYRQATRVGFIDSVADLESILLAKQLNGTLVTTDEGLLHWAREFGAKEMPAAAFGKRMQVFLHHPESTG